MTHRAWQEEPKVNRNDVRVINAHFLPNAILMTIQHRVPEPRKSDYFNCETSFYATFEQAEDLANSILNHLRTNSRDNTSSPENSISGPT